MWHHPQGVLYATHPQIQRLPNGSLLSLYQVNFLALTPITHRAENEHHTHYGYTKIT